MQYNGVKDESLDGSIASDPKQCSSEDLFDYTFAFEDRMATTMLVQSTWYRFTLMISTPGSRTHVIW